MNPPSSTSILVLLLLPALCTCQLKVMVITEPAQQDAFTAATEGIAQAQTDNGDTITLDIENIKINRDDDEANLNDTCSLLLAGGGDYALILDLSWGGWMELAEKAGQAGFPYLRLDAANHQFVQAADDYLRDRDAIDAALVFSSESQLDQSLYFLIGNSYIRVVVIDSTEDSAMTRLQRMRPAPSYYVAHGDSASLANIYREANKRNLVKRDARWTFVFQDWQSQQKFIPEKELGDVQVTLISMDEKDCCIVHNKDPTGSCDCSTLSSPGNVFVKEASRMVGEALINLEEDNKATSGPLDCYATSQSGNTDRADEFESALRSLVTNSQYEYVSADSVAESGKGIQRGALLTYPLNMRVEARNSSSVLEMGSWTAAGGFTKSSTYEHESIPRFFRIGTVPTTPWAFKKTDAQGNVILGPDDKPMLDGYCVEMIEELSERMFFDYELILPTDGSESYGKKDNGTGRWSGIIGDLVNGEIDIAVAGMTMTSEREEVVDFVAPYFDQSGISIIIRKPVRPRSLFKFMEVLRVEVWLAILGALIVTALMLWFLDRYSPYSAQNNREAHPYPCRIFTLKESFWFALTSFTPQGGGEAPKSLSGRVLVAAYWLFVVLMLATFTANLAAFLTVERMQTTVQGLEELAQQSKINYTVVKDSPYFEYFKNMAGAEEELYRVWKDLTLSSDADQSRYRVWDYPIKEQYTHIFKTIQASKMVGDAAEGFKRVLDDHDGTFAFIHDASEVRYEYYNNCNFTEVGEPFAEQPYAVAVQQGSHLQEEISKVILELQKDRYFESLSSKYWNSTLRSLCPTLDDSEGITLTSLGGVFIATLVGLGIAMIVLAFEVYFHRQDQKNSVQDISGEKFGIHSSPHKMPIREGSKFFGGGSSRNSNRNSSNRNSNRSSGHAKNIIHVGSKEIHM